MRSNLQSSLETYKNSKLDEESVKFSIPALHGQKKTANLAKILQFFGACEKTLNLVPKFEFLINL